MTDQEKLKKLFQAALQDSSEMSKFPTRAFPTSSTIPAPASVPVAMPFNQPIEPLPTAAPVAAVVEEEAPVVLPSNAGLDEATSTELGILLDEQRDRMQKKRRRETLVLLAVL
ncbi:MAG: hypothetical protein EOP85_23360, partial [Verrucomicrobiaceae bacterium]